MFCDSCGHQVLDSARFCQNCGRQFPISPIAPTPACSQAPQTVPKKARKLKTAGLVITFSALGLLVLSILSTRQQSETPGKDAGDQSELSTQQTPATPKPEEKPLSPAEMKAAQKVLREKWAEETQKELWRQGMEMTFQTRGTTLFVKYILAGDAFAFQFHEEFLHDNAETMRGLGFETVVLSNGDNVMATASHAAGLNYGRPSGQCNMWEEVLSAIA